jgi:pyruvate formate lyase activating enzyme
MEARYYTRLGNSQVKCSLCPHECTISPGQSGICRVRTNLNGVLSADTYGSVVSMQFDPIEKKPLYHFHPGKLIFSIGSLGCNFHCACCQNYEISQTGIIGYSRVQKVSISEVIDIARSKKNNIGIAYTYNEPAIAIELMTDYAHAFESAGFKNIAVSNGYINTKPLMDILPVMDAFNIDIKAFDKEVHKTFTGGDLENVLHTITAIASSGKHIELTLLVIPGINDDLHAFGKLVDWISKTLGCEIPLHISRYFPRYKMHTEATSLDTMKNMAELAKKSLHYVYTGNTAELDFQDTICPQCRTIVVKRTGYNAEVSGLDSSGCCLKCGYKIAIA